MLTVRLATLQCLWCVERPNAIAKTYAPDTTPNRLMRQAASK
jgi:hypothetical protein